MQGEQMKRSKEAVSLVKSYVSPDLEEIDMTTWKGFLQDLILRTQRVDISAQGAQLAYFFLLSFFPLIIFLVTLLPFLNLQVSQIFDFLQNLMPKEIYRMLEKPLNDILTNRNGGLLSIGILATIWSASKGINALMNGLNKAYDTTNVQGFKTRVLSLVFTFALAIVILLTLLLPVFGQQIVNFITHYMHIDLGFLKIINILSWATPPLLIFVVLIGMYWFVPNLSPRLKFKSVWLGAVFATAAWMLLTYGFSFYISHFGNYSATYGSIGGVIMLMLWLYFTGIILIFGGILNASMNKRAVTFQQLKEQQQQLKA
ncbi:transporter [Lysinibacillus alkalisoli]|uniref:Transporter n=1 Tax=Lysinibacillus alkalisoli TaxID=1911548 RepID=A0A917G9L0_9BACI|nr:YihY/virulence factor BrkB family protein [Lysinibacillus alkalisoli]GGG32162.1 transporter [Lysinibacillus alkalisoli]